MAARKKHNWTRRRLFRAAAATAATLTTVDTITLLSACSNNTQETEEPVVVDTSQAIYIIDPNTNENVFSSIDFELTEGETYDIELGTVLRPGEGKWLAATTVGSTVTPMVHGAALNIETGTLSDVISQTITTDKTNLAIYDVGCSDEVYAWIEMDILSKSWTFYASAFSDGQLTGSPSTLWEANSQWDPPQFAVTGKKVIWQIMPSKSGSKTTESSYCYIWKLGGTDATAVVESPGRFATGPEISGSTVTMSPRVNADKGVYYGITAYSLDDDLQTVIDRLILPQSVSPMCAVRIGDKFVFSIEASYSSGGLLGTMGTYIGTSTGKFVVLSREPRAEVAGKDDLYIIKSRSSYFVVDTDKERYTILSVIDRSVDYGEYPARDGECDTFVTYATVKDSATGYPTGVKVRTFDLDVIEPEDQDEEDQDEEDQDEEK